MSEDFGLVVVAPTTFEQAILRTRVVLRAHGFSILSEMESPPTPGGSPRRSHVFMALWERLISTGNLGGPGLDVGDHLATNVVVFEEGNATNVAVLDPTEGLEGWEAADVAVEAKRALEDVLEEVASGE